jgi:hypothetical protein
MSRNEVHNQFGRLLKLILFIEAVGIEESRHMVMKTKRAFAEEGVKGLQKLRQELDSPENMDKMLLVSILEDIAGARE